ncbi:MAG: cytochrome ubiquinol oxidase subunit I [Candidatus Dormibacteria bacterium]
MLGLQVSLPDFPGIGNNAAIGIAFLIHIAIAEFSLGAITLAVAAEWHHVRTGDPRTLRYARGLTNSYYLLFSLGATFAVLSLVLITGFFGTDIGVIFNRFIWLVATAFGLFFLIAPVLAVYRNTFGRLGARTHALLGLVLLLLQTLFMVLIVGIDAYLINPVDAGLTEPALNPVYWPLLIHRLIGNVSWVALFCAAYAALRIRSSDDVAERGFQAWAARLNLRIGLGTALLMPIAGWFLILMLQSTQPGYFTSLLGGDTASFMVVQECLVGATFIGGNIALACEDGGPGQWPRRSIVAIGLCTAAMTIAALPSAVLPASIENLRYVALGTAMLVTAAHLGWRLGASRWRQDDGLRRTGSASRLGRNALVTIGTAAVVTSLLMGFIKEHARNPYAIYGELTQQDAHQQYRASPGIYP